MVNYTPQVQKLDQKIRIRNSVRELALFVSEMSPSVILSMMDTISIKPSKKGEIWSADPNAYSILKGVFFISPNTLKPKVINLWPLWDYVNLSHFIWLSLDSLDDSSFFDSYSLRQIITLAGSHFHIGLVGSDSLYFTTINK